MGVPGVAGLGADTFASSSVGTDDAAGTAAAALEDWPPQCHQASNARFKNSSAKNRLRTCGFYAIWRRRVGGKHRETPEHQVVLAPIAPVQQRRDRIGRPASQDQPRTAT